MQEPDVAVLANSWTATNARSIKTRVCTSVVLSYVNAPFQSSAMYFIMPKHRPSSFSRARPIQFRPFYREHVCRLR
jgi:hypothetical protein